MLIRTLHTAMLLLLLSFPAFAQVELPSESMGLSFNVDSLIADSIRKEFILTHKPLTVEERDAVVLQKTGILYGEWLKPYMQQVGTYKVFSASTRIHVSRREVASDEWIFYVFLLLLLFLAWVNHSNPVYLKNVFRVYVNEGFIFRQTKDQMEQSVATAFLYNLLFILSGAAFIYFGTGMAQVFDGWERWVFMGMCMVFIMMIYLVKFIFLSFLGWLFQEQESFSNYIFLVYLNAKIIGIIMLFAALLMAFATQQEATQIFRWVGLLVILMTAIRLFRGYGIFSRKAGLFVYLTCVLSIELIPNAVLIKAVAAGFELIVNGIS